MDATNWKAPANDGGVLISPAVPELLSASQKNQLQLTRCSISIAGRPLHDWRRRMRQLLGHSHDEQLLFCTGHQAELYHPGVWIKLALIDHLAKNAEGAALQFAVDSDAPKHLRLRWPGGAVTLADSAQDTAAWAGQLPPPDHSQLLALKKQTQQIAQQWNFSSLLPHFANQLEKMHGAPNLSALLTRAMQQLDRELGLSYELAPTEPLWHSEPYLAFVAHLISHAEEFSACYNHALAEYRREEHIKSPGRPMPDLFRDAEQIELPFWLDNVHTGARQRLRLASTPHGLQWAVNQNIFQCARATPEHLKQFCLANSLRLAPRALTLTMFLRLFVCDQWIHGIGGARYDQVTDRIIQQFFQITPPAFGVATATLFFPSAAARRRVSLPSIRHAGHKLRHDVLGTKKTSYIQAIISAPRRSPQRADIFTHMHQAISESNSPALTQWRAQWNQAQQLDAADRIIFDRELFYALQPATRLFTLLKNFP